MRKKTSALVLAGLISAQTLAPTVTTFANEIENNKDKNQSQVQETEVNTETKENAVEDSSSGDIEESKEENQENIKENINNEKNTENVNAEEVNTTEEQSEDTNDNTRAEVNANIPDAKLKAELNKYVGKMNGQPNRKPTDDILISELNGLTGTLNFNNSGIKNITGIEHLTNASVIYIKMNQISDLSPLGKLNNDKLTHINLSANEIKNISQLATMNTPNLEILHLYNNKIEDISALGQMKLDKLKVLNLYDNQIKDISALGQMNLSNLENLSFYDNQIKDISVLGQMNVPNLTTLWFGRNQIKDISVLGQMNVPNLTKLWAENQSITGEKVRTNKDTAEVYNIVKGKDGKKIAPKTDAGYSYDSGTEKITFKNITDSGDRSYTFTKSVTLGKVTGTFSGTVTHNIEKGEYANIPDPIFKAQLNYYVGKLNSESRKPDDPIFISDLNKLTDTLYFNNLGIKDITGIEHLTNVSRIGMLGNEIESLSPLGKLNAPNLKLIYLYDNKISDLSGLDTMNAPNLEILHLHTNNISDISAFGKMNAPKLKSISLGTNQIKDISALGEMNLPNLKEILLNNNQIEDISVLGKMDVPSVTKLRVENQAITGEKVRTNKDTAEVYNIVKGKDGKKIAPKTDAGYSYDSGTEKITFKNITDSGDRSYTFEKQVTIGDATGTFAGTVTHNIEKTEPAIEASLSQEKGGIMLSTAGKGLRFFTTMKNVSDSEHATYYITTASNSKEIPKFEVKSTVVKGDYTQLKTSIKFDELNKLDADVNTKLYVKRVVEGQEPTYTELKSGDVNLTNPFKISDKNILIAASKGENNVVQLNKNISENTFEQGLSKVYWNPTGMVVEGTPKNNGNNTDFNNAKVSMTFKDFQGEYIKEKGMDAKLEVRGMYRDGKYKVTIPYEVLTNVNTFELRLIGSNIQTSDVLTKGSVEDFKQGLKDNKIFKLSAGDDNIVKLTSEELGKITSELTSSMVTTDKQTAIRQFSISGSVNMTGIDNIGSDVEYSIVGKKGEKILFEQSATKTSDNGFKTNISLSKLIDANLAQNDEVSLKIKVEYLGNTIEVDLNSTQESVSTTDKASKETFEMTSKGGKAIVVKK